MQTMRRATPVISDSEKVARLSKDVIDFRAIVNGFTALQNGIAKDHREFMGAFERGAAKLQTLEEKLAFKAEGTSVTKVEDKLQSSTNHANAMLSELRFDLQALVTSFALSRKRIEALESSMSDCIKSLSGLSERVESIRVELHQLVAQELIRSTKATDTKFAAIPVPKVPLEADAIQMMINASIVPFMNEVKEAASISREARMNLAILQKKLAKGDLSAKQV